VSDLRAGAETSSTVLVVWRSAGGRLYWRDEVTQDGRAPVIYGPGFAATADDFPEGTKLIVQARIEIPGSKQENVDG